MIDGNKFEKKRVDEILDVNFTMLLKSQIKVKIKKKSKIPRENSRKKILLSSTISGNIV